MVNYLFCMFLPVLSRPRIGSWLPKSCFMRALGAGSGRPFTPLDGDFGLSDRAFVSMTLRTSMTRFPPCCRADLTCRCTCLTSIPIDASTAERALPLAPLLSGDLLCPVRAPLSPPQALPPECSSEHDELTIRLRSLRDTEPLTAFADRNPDPTVLGRTGKDG